MLQQQLINAFMKFTAKAGAGEFIRQLIQATDDNGNPKVWTEAEMMNAISFLEDQTRRFGRDEAAVVIARLMRKFSISLNDVPPMTGDDHHEDIGITGVKGLL